MAGVPNPSSHWPTLVTAVRCLSAGLGTVAWIAWWLAAAHQEAPERLFFLWLAAFVLWGAALFTRWPIPRPTGLTFVALCIGGAGLVARVVSLADNPYMVTTDEAIDPLLGLDVLRHHPWEILSGTSVFFGQANATMVLQTWPCLLLGPLLGMRVASVLLAIVSLLSTYALAHRLFGRGSALVALTILAASFWHIVYSRVGYHYMQPMAFVPLAMHVTVFGHDTRNRFCLFLGGAFLAATLLVYVPARLVIPVFALWIIHRAVIGRLAARFAAETVMFVILGGILFISPYLQQSGTKWLLARFLGTSLNVNGPLHVLGEKGLTSAESQQFMRAQFRAAVEGYIRPGAWFAPGDFTDAPLVDPLSLGLAGIGLAVALVRWRDAGHFLLVVWVAATFVSAQMLTDVPAAAYRAGPILPALALAAACGATAITALVRRVLHRRLWWIEAGAFAALLLVVTSVNLGYLNWYLGRRRNLPWVAMARLIGAGSTAPVYYVVHPADVPDPIFAFIGDGHTIRGIPDLMDSLGTDIDTSRDAVFVLSDWTLPAAGAIRRCYPGANLLHERSTPRDAPILALAVSKAAVVAGEHCTVAPSGHGLRARYYAGSAWDGAVVLDRIEDWPVRFRYDLTRFASAEWSGSLIVPVAGDYAFQLMGSDAVGEAAIGAELQLSLTDTRGARLTAGTYPLSIRCRPTSAAGMCWLRWRPSGGDWQGIAPDRLLPPEANPRH